MKSYIKSSSAFVKVKNRFNPEYHRPTMDDEIKLAIKLVVTAITVFVIIPLLIIS